MIKLSIDITITLKAPFLTQASSPGDLGYDMVVARHNNGTPYIPGTLITGKLRQALEELQSTISTDSDLWFKPKLEQWFGMPQNQYHGAKQLYLSDFDLSSDDMEKLNTTGTRDRITIDPARGAIEKHQIVMAENSFVAGEAYQFIGKLHCCVTSATEANSLTQHLNAGLRWMSQIGAMRTTGYGEVIDIKIVSSEKLIPSPQTIAPQEGDTFALQITPLYPFCLSTKPKSDNQFNSEVIISGASIIGCIATTWGHLCGVYNGRIDDIQDEMRPELKAAFSQIRITHAFPCQDSNQRPVVTPLSCVTSEKSEQLYDVAELEHPCLINKNPPNFAINWKNTDNTLKEYPWPYIRLSSWGWPTINTELRVRTAIDSEHLRAKESQLFAYEQVIPDNTTWLANIDFSRVDKTQQAAVKKQLISLLNEGIIGLGKTKTPASILIGEKPATPNIESDTTPHPQNTWIITLQTDALLGSPEKLRGANQQALQEMYEQTITDLSSGSLKLQRYFARQSLSGGEHQRHRYQKSLKLYTPWVLTEAGSVFVVTATQDPATAQATIEKWLQHGLPLSTETCRYYGIDSDENKQWQQTPYIQQNGYGEIAVNLQTNDKVINLKNASGIQLSEIKETATQQENNHVRK